MKRRELIVSGLALSVAGALEQSRSLAQEALKGKVILGEHVGPVKQLAYSPDGRWLVSSASPLNERLLPSGGETRLWDTRAGKISRVLLPEHEAQVIRWSRDGRTLALPSMRWNKDGSGTSGRVELWDTSSADASQWQARHTLGKADAASIPALSPDSKYFLSGIGGREQSGVLIWDAESGEEVGRLGEQTGFLASSCFAADGKTLVTASWRGKAGEKFEGSALQWWDTSGAPGEWDLKRVLSMPERIGYAVLSPDGETLLWVRWADDFATTSLVVADAGSGQVRREVKGTGWFFAPQWSPDGRLLAVSHTLNATDRPRIQSQVQLFDTRNWNISAVMGASKHMISGLAFSPDGASLAMGSGENAVEIFPVH